MDYSFPTFRRLAYLWGPSYASTSQSRSLLRLIATAIEDNLPLGPLLESWAADEWWTQKRRLQRLVRLLHGGTPLPEAIEEVAGVLRDEHLLAIRFDAQTGTRTAAMRATLDDCQGAIGSRAAGARDTILYFCIVLVVGLLSILFGHFRIVPILSQILDSFGVTQPQVLQWSMHWSTALVNGWWLIALFLLALLWMIFSTGTGRYVRRAILGRLFNPWRELYAADVLRKLGIAAGAGKPLAGVLSTLARYHFDPVIRQKLLFVRNEVEQGAEVWQSMSAVGLLTPPEVHLLDTAERLGNRPWALQQLVGCKRRHTRRRWEKLSVLLLPALVIVMGAFVLFQALTVFLPLTEILRAL